MYVSLEHITNFTSHGAKSPDQLAIKRLTEQVETLQQHQAQLIDIIEQLTFELSRTLDRLVKHPQEQNDTLEASAENIYTIGDTIHKLYESSRLSPDEPDEHDEFSDLF